MSRRGLLLYLCMVLFSAGRLPAQQTPRAVLDKYCVTCHNERLKTAGLMLDKVDVDHVATDAELWEKVLRKLHAREMPPPATSRPDSSTYQAIGAFFEKALDEAASTNPNPGRVAVHRLN